MSAMIWLAVFPWVVVVAARLVEEALVMPSRIGARRAEREADRLERIWRRQR